MIVHAISLSLTLFIQVPRLLNFFLLNSAEHEIYSAHKCKNVGILTFISMINTTSERLKA